MKNTNMDTWNQKKTEKIAASLYTILFLFVLFCILTNASLSLLYAQNGLELWFNHMIPTLLPFMILSGTLVRMGLSEGFVTLLYPFLKPLFGVSKNACYVMVMGFMCGFPMGAKCIDDLYSRGEINHKEAAWLLYFCNNIGPVYFVSFALPMIGCSRLDLCLFGMYGIPLLYGLFLRHTLFRDISCQNMQSNTMAKPQKLLEALNESVFSALQSIAMLGGYMILFNLFMMVPQLFAPQCAPIAAPLLEITGGLKLLDNKWPVYSLVLLHFGGLSCIAQTYSCIAHTELSIRSYIWHKIVLSFIAGGYYFLCLRFFLL